MYKLYLKYFSFILLFLFGCSKTEPIKIGLAVNLTGRYSEMGVAARNGLQIAVEEINKAGGVKGRPIQLLIKDDHGTAEGSLDAVKQLQNEGCFIIVGPLITAATPKSFEYVNKNQLIMISPSVSTDIYSGKKDNFYRLITSIANQAEVLAKSAVQLKFKRVYAIYEEHNLFYSKNLIDIFNKSFSAQGGSIIDSINFVSTPETDYKDIIKKVIAKNPDAIISIGGAIDNAMLCQELAKAKSNIKVLSGMWCLNNNLITHGGASAERMMISGSIDFESNSANFVNFTNKYKQRYNLEPLFFSYYSYDSGTLIKQVIQSIKGELNFNSFKAVIDTVRIVHALEGDLPLDQFGDTPHKCFLYVVRDNKFQKVQLNEYSE